MLKILSFRAELDTTKLSDIGMGVSEALRANIEQVDGHIPDTDLFVFDLDKVNDARNITAIAATKHHILQRIERGYVAIGFAGNKHIANGRHNYQVFDDGINVENLSAREVVFNDSNAIGASFKSYENNMVHSVVLSAHSGDKIAENKSGQTIGYVRKQGEGYLFVLPRPKDKTDFLAYFVKQVLPKLNTSIQLGINTETPPAFLKTISIVGEESAKESIKQQEEVIQNEINKLEIMKGELDGLQAWKELLWQTDKRLENVVHKAFALLGQDLETTENDVDLQGISPDGRKILIEVKGRQGGIGHDDYRQIYERKYSFDSANPKNTIAILIGNAFRKNPLENRPPEGQTFFAPHSIDSSKDHNIGLVKTIDLYNAVCDVLDPEKSVDNDKILQSLFDCVGEYKYIS